MSVVAGNVQAKIANAQKKVHMKGTMKWLPYMSTFVLNKISSIIKSGVRTEKGFKEIHLNACTKAFFEHCGVKVSGTHVYNHLRKWRVRWIHISKLRDVSDAKWDDDTYTILLSQENYQGHVVVSSVPP
jgi:hypothetical protein